MYVQQFGYNIVSILQLIDVFYDDKIYFKSDASKPEYTVHITI